MRINDNDPITGNVAAGQQGDCSMKRVLSILLLFTFASADAALIDRGGGFIYDDVLNITWMQDADINGFDTWDNHAAWADGLSLIDPVRNVTWSDWRLPATPQPDASCAEQLDPGGGFPLQGHGLGCTGSELGHLFNVDGISPSSPGPFVNVGGGPGTGTYFSMEYEPDPTNFVWIVTSTNGDQGVTFKDTFTLAWAVRDGDVGPDPFADTDGDGVPDTDDNCTLVANGPNDTATAGPSQNDTNGDGYGNMCDADLNNDLVVNGLDVGLFVTQFGTSGPDADLNGDGVVNGLDTGLFVGMFGQAPGPSGLTP